MLNFLKEAKCFVFLLDREMCQDCTCLIYKLKSRPELLAFITTNFDCKDYSCQKQVTWCLGVPQCISCKKLLKYEICGGATIGAVLVNVQQKYIVMLQSVQAHLYNIYQNIAQHLNSYVYHSVQSHIIRLSFIIVKLFILYYDTKHNFNSNLNMISF